MKPNVKTRNLHSDVLNQDFKLDITMKARKCIIKAGSLDNYLLNTKPTDIDSKFGLYLRELIQRKKADPEFAVPYIKGQAKLPRSRKTSVWEYKQIPSIYMPAHAKVSEDHSKYFFKTPQEMSRHEIANLEQMLREIDEPDEFIPDEEMWASDEFQDLKRQMLAMQPVRHGLFKKYFDKYKFNKKKREMLLQYIKDSEDQVEDILAPSGEFVPFTEAIPEIKTFLAEVEAREKLIESGELDASAGETQTPGGKGKAAAQGTIKEGSKQGELIEEVPFDPEKFNPFDKQSIKREEEQEKIKPNQARKVYKVRK